MKSTIITLIVLFKIFTISAQLSGTYQIGASQTYPFNTLKNAVEQINMVGVSGPVRFILTDVLYEEDSIEFKTISGTSITNTITLQPGDNIDVEIMGSGGFIIGIDRTSNLIFNGFSPNGTGSLTITSTESITSSTVIKSTTPVNTNGNMYNIHIINCTINAAPPFFPEDQEPKSFGIEFSSTSGNFDTLIFQNNVFTGGDKSIVMVNSKFKKIEIIDNNFLSSGGLDLGNFGVIDDKIIKIQGNVFTNTNLGYSLGDLSVINVFVGQELTFTNNVFYGINYNFTSFKDDCILFHFNTIKNAFVFNNQFKNINYNASFNPSIDLGTLVHLFYFSNTENIKFFHNSIYIPYGNDNAFVLAP